MMMRQYATLVEREKANPKGGIGQDGMRFVLRMETLAGLVTRES